MKRLKMIIRSYSSALLLLSVVAFSACNHPIENAPSTPIDEEENQRNPAKLSEDQVLAYVDLWGAFLEGSGKPESQSTRSIDSSKEVDNVDYCIENGDTLLFAVNYKNDGGFVILKATNASFPIIGHADSGNLIFNDISDENPLKEILDIHKKKVQEDLLNTETNDSQYLENWNEIGDPNFQYEIIPINSIPEESQSTRARTETTGKVPVYPSTGKELDAWEQKGSFNEFAPYKAAIGCPAIAVGMLLYDCNNRFGGDPEDTQIKMPFWAMYATPENESGKSVSKILKEVADSIPNYSWGEYFGAPSGALPNDILIGLHNLGFKKAKIQNYDFETLYRNLRYKTIGYGGVEITVSRGVLLGGLGAYVNPYGRVGYVGHIWFCDGYYEQAYEVTKKFLGIKIKSWKEYDDRLYMNWGHGAKGGNGWFNATEGYWNSLDKRRQPYNHMLQMYVDLHEYQRPMPQMYF